MNAVKKKLRDAAQYRMNKEFNKAEALLCKILEEEPGNLKALEELLKVYKNTEDYEKEELLIQKILAQNPDHIFALQEYACIDFERGRWKESISKYSDLQKKLGDLTENSDELWLKIHKIIVKTLLIMKSYEEVQEQRWQAYKKLSSKQDLFEIVNDSSLGANNRIYNIETEMFVRGQASFYTCLHSIEGYKNNCLIVEKCLRSSSNELLVYKAIQDYNLFETTDYARTPKVKKIVTSEKFVKLYLSYIKGENISFPRVDFYGLGAALGEIADEFSAIMPYHEFEMKLLKPLNLNKLAEYFSKASYESNSVIARTFTIIDQFYAHLDRINALSAKIPKVFSHNDMALGNIFSQQDVYGERYYFIDWEKASYNSAGSDIGGILKWKVFNEMEKDGRAKEAEGALVKGYYSTFSAVGQKCYREELVFSYNLHFIHSGINTVISRRDFYLLQRIAERCKLVLEMVGKYTG